MCKLHFVFPLVLLLAAGMAIEPDPADVATRLALQLASQGPKFFPPDEYGTSLLYQALYECFEAFPALPGQRVGNTTLEAFIEKFLDMYTQIPGLSPYIVLHNSSFSWDSAIGDRKGLFPLAYLERATYKSAGSPGYDNTTDVRIAAGGVNTFILPYPFHLSDGTIARQDGSKAWPFESTPSYLWGDDQFMGLTLPARLATVMPSAEMLPVVNWLATQASSFRGYMQSSDGLFFHGVRVNTSGAFTSCCKWGRANGWGLMAHIEVMGAIDAMIEAGFQITGRQQVLQTLQSHAAGIANNQSPDGRWHQVLDQNWTYLETSATAMNVFALARGSLAGWLHEESVLPAITKGWAALAAQVAANGTVAGICSGTPILPTATAYNEQPTSFDNSLNGGLGAVLRAAAAISHFHSARI